MPDRIVTEDQWEKSMRKLQIVKRCFKNGENQEGARLTDEVIDDIRGWKEQTTDNVKEPEAKDNPHVEDELLNKDAGHSEKEEEEEEETKSSEASEEDTEDEESEEESEDKGNSDPLSFSTKD